MALIYLNAVKIYQIYLITVEIWRFIFILNSYQACCWIRLNLELIL